MSETNKVASDAICRELFQHLITTGHQWLLSRGGRYLDVEEGDLAGAIERVTASALRNNLLDKATRAKLHEQVDVYTHDDRMAE